MADDLPGDMLGILAKIKSFHSIYSKKPSDFGLTDANSAALGNSISSAENILAQEADLAAQQSAIRQQRRSIFKELEKEYRAQRQDAKFDRNISPENRAKLGLDEPDAKPTAISAPTTRPVLEVDTSKRLEHVVEFYDETANNTGRRAKPEGVGTCEIHYAVTAQGEAPPADPANYKYHSDDSASPCEVLHEAQEAGKTAHYIGRWKTRTGLTGDWSQTVSATITG